MPASCTRSDKNLRACTRAKRAYALMSDADKLIPTLDASEYPHGVTKKSKDKGWGIEKENPTLFLLLYLNPHPLFLSCLERGDPFGNLALFIFVELVGE